MQLVNCMYMDFKFKRNFINKNSENNFFSDCYIKM